MLGEGGKGFSFTRFCYVESLFEEIGYQAEQGDEAAYDAAYQVEILYCVD
jgi:hypothetical protein